MIRYLTYFDKRGYYSGMQYEWFFTESRFDAFKYKTLNNKHYALLDSVANFNCC